MAELPFSSTQLLAGLASTLLLFVSLGVVYLSTVEWRDRRRRRAAEAGSGRTRAASAIARGLRSRGSSPRP